MPTQPSASATALSKSKLLAYRQCPKRLWLEAHRPDLAEVSEEARAALETGRTVGAVARRVYDPQGHGIQVIVDADGIGAALARSGKLLGGAQPLFEAGFRGGGALAFADILLPSRRAGRRSWRLIEVKSATGVKDYYRDDVAIQAHVARSADVPLSAITLAHVDSGWVYPGGEDYRGLFTEHDLTAQSSVRGEEVERWIADAQAVVRRRTEPRIATGRHCADPHPCAFVEHCRAAEPQAEYPVDWLPNKSSKALAAAIGAGARDMRDIDDSLLNERQLRVKTQTLAGTRWFDARGAATDLAPHALPACFLDFESIGFAVPIWKGTRPYEHIPFQFSVQRLSRAGSLDERPFLDLSGNDPSEPLAEALVEACGGPGPVFAYQSGFERARITGLAARVPKHRRALEAIAARLADLLPVARERYYHPDQCGSWSIKSVLPTIPGGGDYSQLDGVRDGGMAMTAYREAIAPDTTAERRAAIERELLRYCAMDTYATVQLWRYFSGQPGSRA